ncbi:porin PorA family protein [Streptomyces triticiradicis]|uniref:DUF3068 domain-containing protein n=1 Tax=Streptomyces triticiradicis TaxID=2651189 RepID=A0A7J5D5G5_9ACTN|nr:DUF3068 domain-containing protein [Streptomyces triticiradicis]
MSPGSCTWPLDPEKRDHRFRDSGIRKTVPARYTGQDSVDGRSAYRYDTAAADRSQSDRSAAAVCGAV